MGVSTAEVAPARAEHRALPRSGGNRRRLAPLLLITPLLYPRHRIAVEAFRDADEARKWKNGFPATANQGRKNPNEAVVTDRKGHKNPIPPVVSGDNPLENSFPAFVTENKHQIAGNRIAQKANRHVVPALG